MGEPRILAVAPGDPRDPRTWSGTPSALCDVLDKRGLLAGACDTSALLAKPAKSIAHGFSRLYYYPATLTGYGRFVRRAKGRAVSRVIGRGSFDAVLHFMTTHLPLPPVMRPARNYLYVDTSQRLWSRYFSPAVQRRGRLERDVQQLERETFAQMDHIFTVSHYLRDDLIEHYGVDPSRITVAGTGRGKIEPYLGLKRYDVPRVLYVALNWQEKGGQLALDGFLRARERRADMTMTIVCERPKAEELTALALPGVTALTRIPWNDLQRLYDEATLFVMPAGFQPWGLAYVEALACRAPIVGLDRLSTAELTGHGAFGWALPDEDSEALAEVILEAHADPQRLAEMGHAGQAYCLEHFSWERVADLIERQVRRDTASA